MFFTNLATWSKVKLRAVKIALSLVYFGLIAVAPIIVISCKYNLFVNAKQVGKLNGFGLIVFILFAVIGLRAFKKSVHKLPDVEPKEQRLKYTLLMTYALAIPILALYVLTLFRSNFELAYITFRWCIWFVIGGIAVDYLFLEYLDKEIELRNKAKEVNAVELRRDIIK